MAIRLVPGDNPVLSKVTDLGAFVMGRRMVTGLKVRAEGGRELPGIEGIEILLWVAALAAGLGAAVLFVARRAWQAPLLLGLAALLALIWFTAWQPAVWLRLLVDLALLVLLWWVARPGKRAARTERAQTAG